MSRSQPSDQSAEKGSGLMIIAPGRLIALAVPLTVAAGVAAAFLTGALRFGGQAGVDHAGAPAIQERAAPASPDRSRSSTQGAPAAAGPGTATSLSHAADAPAEVSGLAEALASLAPVPQRAAPAFDVARIERSGSAVIAGTTEPGAGVELLRGDEVIDRAVADRNGQFVMTPPALPRGEYELTLRSRKTDGSERLSTKGVAVSLLPEPRATERPSAAAPAAAAAGPVAAAPAPARQEAVGSVDAAMPAGGASAHASTTIVSRGDSLWQISRARYGSGMRYMAIFKANRGHIRNPDRIYPGQTFLVPDIR
jgi:nucleoid-associated protein YgaU